MSPVFRCRWLDTNRGLDTPLFESAFVAAGLKLCGGTRRAAQVCRPYGGYRSRPFFRRGRTLAGPREGHTPGWLLSAFGQFIFRPSPTGFKDTFRFWVGEALGPPAGICTSYHLLGKARRSCGIAAAAIFHLARAQWPGCNRRKPLRFCAPEIIRSVSGGASVNGVQGPTPLVKGRWPKARGDRDGRHGGREALPILPIAPIPWCLFGSFLGIQKGTRPSGRNPAKEGGEIPCTDQKQFYPLVSQRFHPHVNPQLAKPKPPDGGGRPAYLLS